jgi:hypothetical protein
MKARYFMASPGDAASYIAYRTNEAGGNRQVGEAGIRESAEAVSRLDIARLGFLMGHLGPARA